MAAAGRTKPVAEARTIGGWELRGGGLSMNRQRFEVPVGGERSIDSGRHQSPPYPSAPCFLIKTKNCAVQ